ncbi:FAD/FMN-dependent dehydrogenase [Rhizobium leguminosarum bv. trifolii WSM2297]|uniref:FAD/FMN-dependent dehydrogenase n=1 Tax=Rhizobium leguminosarum bv. trifolii WSM2297 TaxID=754762 RepID=J0KTT2_RHILT|nr:FAD-binding oxidoreductase [Rhizobium leguminosarum]EJC81064.1 FAD/FMN-dependent dehydrogenase [Rhizobium leguminosarum bv. trifolii WSM2297]
MPLHPDPSACLATLAQALPSVALLVGPDIPARNRQDTSYLPSEPPLAVVRPDNPQDIAEAMRICAAHGIAVVPQGGLTGLAGGAHPIDGAVMISLERYSGIEEIDPAASTMTVRAGTPLEVIQRAADDAGFFIPLDLGARGSCQIGGNLGTNAGGNRVIRYGMAREMVLGLEYVLADGSLVTGLNKMIKNNAGYDLKQLFIGSEGTLGIITRAVLRMQPKPGCVNAALCGLNSYAEVVALLGAARRGLGPMLSAFEVMWPDYWHEATVTIGVRSPLAAPHGFYVLIESQGLAEDIDGPRFQSWIEARFEAGLIADAAISQSMGDVAAFWATRDACSEFGTRLGPHCAFDIGLPVAKMDDFVTACRQRLAEGIPNVLSVYYGHIGDGNLHLVALSRGAEKQPMAEISASVYETVRDFGGTISAEHGIGLLKKPYLNYTRTPEELALMRQIKAALDPQGILNPGKVFDLEESK